VLAASKAPDAAIGLLRHQHCCRVATPTPSPGLLAIKVFTLLAADTLVFLFGPGLGPNQPAGRQWFPPKHA